MQHLQSKYIKLYPDNVHDMPRTMIGSTTTFNSVSKILQEQVWKDEESEVTRYSLNKGLVYQYIFPEGLYPLFDQDGGETQQRALTFGLVETVKTDVVVQDYRGNRHPTFDDLLIQHFTMEYRSIKSTDWWFWITLILCIAASWVIPWIGTVFLVFLLIYRLKYSTNEPDAVYKGIVLPGLLQRCLERCYSIEAFDSWYNREVSQFMALFGWIVPDPDCLYMTKCIAKMLIVNRINRSAGFINPILN